MVDAQIEKGRVQSFVEAVLRLRWWVIALTALAAAISGYGLRYLSFNPDSRLFFGVDNPERLALEAMENTYSKDNNALFILAPKNGDVFTRDTLSLIALITERAWQTPYSSRVNSITNYQNSYAEGDELIVEDLVENASELSDADLLKIREIALDSPDLVNLLVSSKGDVTAISILVTQSENKRKQVPEIAAFVRALADEVRRDNPEVDIYLSGGVMADITFAEAGQRDMRTLVPLMILLIVVMLTIGLSSAIWWKTRRS